MGVEDWLLEGLGGHGQLLWCLVDGLLRCERWAHVCASHGGMKNIMAGEQTMEA